MDRWTLGPARIETGLEQFGRPRGAFPAHAYVTDSKEAKAALAQQAANAEAQARARMAAIERQAAERRALREQEERERKAREERERAERLERERREEEARLAADEQRRREEAERAIEAEKAKAAREAARKKLLEATAVGARYLGSWRRGDTSRGLRLAFTARQPIPASDDYLIEAEFTNPGDPGAKSKLKGQLVMDPKEGSHIQLRESVQNAPGSGQDSANYYFFERLRSAALHTTDAGLAGTAIIEGRRYDVVLDREGAPSSGGGTSTPRPGPRPAPSGAPEAAPPRIRKGDILVVAKENTPVMSGTDTVATVAAGTRVTALEVVPDPTGSWVKVQVLFRGMPRDGYIHSTNLKLASER